MIKYFNLIYLILSKIFYSVTENGTYWTFLAIKRRLYLKRLSIIENKLENVESNRSIKGFNSILQNTRFWEKYNWDLFGEEWTPSDVWKKTFNEEIIEKNINSNDTILEIGPGGGRFTEFLVRKAKTLWLADITDISLKICKDRFNNYKNINYNKVSGIKLNFIEPNSIDVIFSFDVFIHIDPINVDDYFSEFKKIIKPNGKIILNISTKGDFMGNFFSKLDFVRLKEIALNYGFLNITIYNQQKFCIIPFQELYEHERIILLIQSI